MRRVKGKTVYLLGAGFSFGTGTPLLSNFIPKGIELLAGSNNDSLLEKTEQVLEQYLAAAEFLPNRLINLEDLFCLVDLRKQYAGEQIIDKESHESILKRFVIAVLEKAWGNHRKEWETVKQKGFATGTISTLPVVPQHCVHDFKSSTVGLSRTLNTDQYYNACAYEAFLSYILHKNNFVSSVDEADVIVTLNYDLVIERKLWKIADNPICYGNIGGISSPRTAVFPAVETGWSAKKPLPLLKIHGSINWLGDTTNPSKIQKIVSPSGKMNHNQISRISIVPPTWRKTAAANTVFARLLGSALHHMRIASQIVIIGYSLPSTDSYFRYLLAEAIGTPVLPQIELWDVIAESELRNRIMHALGSRIERVATVKSIEQKGFLEFVASHTIKKAVR